MFGKLFLLFILVPVAELYLFLTLGSQLGFDWTIAIIIVTALIGASLTKSQGRRALLRFQKATQEGRIPASETFDGVLILLAGAVLLTPGFLTDAVGFTLLVPAARSYAARHLGKRFKDHVKVMPGQTFPQGEPASKPKSQLDDGKVIDV